MKKILFLFCSFFLAFAKPSLEIPKLSKQAKQNFILENVKFNYNGTIYKIFIAKNKNDVGGKIKFPFGKIKLP